MVENEDVTENEDVDMVVVGGDDDDDFSDDLLDYRPGEPLDRPRGLLSERDREYLYGERDIEPKSQSERNVRGDIRERARNALIDFSILLWQLDPRDRRQIFDSSDKNVRSGIADTLGFLYHETKPTRFDFEELLELGIDRGERSALRRQGYSSDTRRFGPYYNVALEVERVAATPNPPDTLKQIGKEIERGNAGTLTAGEIRMFFNYYAYAEEFDPELPAAVFSSLSMGVDAARRPKESLEQMREQGNSSLEDFGGETDTCDE